jgi:hypothetical protein
MKSFGLFQELADWPGPDRRTHQHLADQKSSIAGFAKLPHCVWSQTAFR